jgi:hypothetical protein
MLDASEAAGTAGVSVVATTVIVAIADSRFGMFKLKP